MYDVLVLTELATGLINAQLKTLSQSQTTLPNRCDRAFTIAEIYNDTLT